MRISAWWLLAAFAVAVIGTALFFAFIYIPVQDITHRKSKNYDIVTFKLPNSGNTAVFGPRQWAARHYLDNIIPCSICREHAIPLGIFNHDIVNLSIDKPVFNRANWKEHVKIVNELDKKVS